MIDFFNRGLFISKQQLCCKIILLFFVLGSFQILQGQSLDNLEKKYLSQKDDGSDRISIVTSYLSALYANNKEDEANKIVAQNITIALKKSDYDTASVLYCIKAMNLLLLNEKIESEKNLSLAKRYSNKTNNKETKGYVSYCEGWLNSRNNKQGKAVQDIITAIKYYDASPQSNTLNKRKSTANNELSVIYANLHDDELNEKYAKIALDYALKQDDPQIKFSAFMKMGNLYDRLFSIHPAQINYRNLAEKYFLQSIDIFNENKNIMYNLSDLSYANNNLASLYLYSFPKSYKNKALEYAKIANEIALKADRADHVASSYGIISSIYLANLDTNNAIFYLLEAQKAIHKSNIVDRNIELNIYESLVEIYEQQGNYKEALRNYRLYMTTYKSIFDKEQAVISKRLEAQFDKERQEQRVIRLQLESEKKEQQIGLMHSLGVLQKQELDNVKLREEFQRKQLKLSLLESDKRSQELTISQQNLKLSKLENKNRKDELASYITELNFKNKLNKYYIFSFLFIIILFVLLLYMFRQRSKHAKQREELYKLELEKERQNSKISTLTALLNGQEQERTRLARDLHDGLGGILSGTKIQLTHLNDRIDEKSKEDMEKSIRQLDGAVDELRRVAHNLMPDLLLKYGLEEALKEYANRMSNDYLDIDVQFLSYANSLDKEQQLLVYRIVQELVNNAIKHAFAKQIIIQIVEDEADYTIIIEDDGKGFNIDKTKDVQSAGLHNIQSRVQFLKGKLNIHSEINLGTTIEFKFPKK